MAALYGCAMLHVLLWLCPRALTPTIRTAEILAVGTELLTPFRVDTNSLYLTQQLNDLGIDVEIKSVVTRDPARWPIDCGTRSSGRISCITTGWPGPTSDDIHARRRVPVC
jgi:molybdopterin-biosynthesis enzyme MoeA-like protein